MASAKFGRTEGRTDGRTHARTDGRTDAGYFIVPLPGSSNRRGTTSNVKSQELGEFHGKNHRGL